MGGENKKRKRGKAPGYNRSEENAKGDEEIKEGVENYENEITELDKEYNTGFQAGHAEGHELGFEAGFESGHEKGNKTGFEKGLKTKINKQMDINPVPKLSPPSSETKIVVFDTSALMQYPDIIDNMSEKLEYPIIFVIPNVVNDELDENKSWSKEARSASRFINKVIFAQGGKTTDFYLYKENKIIISDISQKTAQKRLPAGHKITNDKIIIVITALWKERYPEHDIRLLSLDNNLLNSAGAITNGINIKFPEGAIPQVNMPKPFTKIILTAETTNELNDPVEKKSNGPNINTINIESAEKNNPTISFSPNQLVFDRESEKFFTVSNDKKVLLLSDKCSEISSRNYTIPKEMTSPRNQEQKYAMNSLLNPDIPLVFLIGTAGTGKTLLALLAAILQLSTNRQDDNTENLEKVKNLLGFIDYYNIQRGTYENMTVSRPHVPLSKEGQGAGKMGWLPGDEKHKMAPWLRPIRDNLRKIFPFSFTRNGEKINYKSLEDFQNTINFESLSYIRGRSFGSEFIIVDEVQNLDPPIVKTILTRAGENTKIVLTGDPYQIDNPYLNKTNNGLIVAAEMTKHLPQTAIHVLEIVERSELSKVIGALNF